MTTAKVNLSNWTGIVEFAACAAAGIGCLSLHGLRRSFGALAGRLPTWAPRRVK